jgi:hypothetical protein
LISSTRFEGNKKVTETNELVKHLHKRSRRRKNQMKQNKTQVLRFKVRKKEEEELRRVSVSEKFDGNNENVFPLWPVKFPPFSFLSQFFFFFLLLILILPPPPPPLDYTHTVCILCTVCVCVVGNCSNSPNSSYLERRAGPGRRSRRPAHRMTMRLPARSNRKRNRKKKNRI